MKRKKKIMVLMGGKSPEHEISVISGKQVVASLDENKYDVYPVVISKTGTKWQLISKKELLGLSDLLRFKGSKKEIIKAGKNNIENIDVMSSESDCVFIAMHGPLGEDGTIQGMLELAGINYTGSGVLASALGMDKIAFRKYLSEDGINFPKYLVMEKGDSSSSVKKVLGDPPYFVKPHNQGSSVGNSIVKSEKDLKKALDLAYSFSDKVLVDEYIKGREVTVGLLGNKDPLAMSVVEIVPLKNEYFDYESKYTESGAEEIVPARISKRMTKKLQDIAKNVHTALNCKGFSRVDFILKNDKVPYVLEINTIPGLTPMSLLPKAAKASGISYSKLLDKIIDHAN